MYRAYENPKDTFDQFILQNKKRWQCNYSILTQEDLELLGIKQFQGYEVEFPLLKSIIERESKKSNMVFATCNVFHLVHRKEDYLQRQNLHWVIASSKRDFPDMYSLFDDNSNGIGNFTERVYNEDSFRIAFENNSLRYYQFYTVNTNIKEIDFYSNLFIERACEYFSNSAFSLHYYDQIPDLLEENSSNKDNLNALLDQIIEGLAYLSGSRYLFQRFLVFVNRLHKTQDLLSKIIDEINTLKLMHIKYKISNKCDLTEIKKRFKQIKENEIIVIDDIKSHFNTVKQ